MSDSTTPETQERPQTSPAPPRRRRIRRLHFHLSIWTMVSILSVTLFLVLASMSLTGRVVVLPGWVTEQVLARMNASMDQGGFTLRQVEFGVTRKGRPKLRLVDIGIRDATGLEVARLNRVEGGFHLGAALLGRVEPTVVTLRGAQVTLRRLPNGSFALSLGQQEGTTGDLAAVLDAIDGVFTDGMLAGAEEVKASGLTITLEDARSGRLWQVTDGQMDISQTDTLVDIVVSFDVFNQTEELAHTVLSFRSAKGSSEASLSAQFDNAAAADIAAQSPALAFLSVIDAPISGALRTSIDGNGAISELAGALSLGSGALSPTPGAPPAAFDGAKVYIDYDPGTQRLDMLGLSARSEIGTIEGEGHFYLTDFSGGWPGSLIGQVQLTSARLNPTDVFAQPLDIDRGVADFRLRLDPFTFEIGQAVAFRGGRRYEANGQIAAGSDGWSVAIDGAVATADKPEVLALWPIDQGNNGRTWFAKNVHEVEAFDSRLVFRQDPGGDLRMDGVYNLRNGSVSVIDTLPPIHVELGYLTQTPTTLTVVVDKGHIVAPDGSVMDLSGMTYHAPDLTLENQTDIVDLRMRGPASGALAILAAEPFTVFEGTGFGPDVARGTLEARGIIAFPGTGEPVTIDSTDFTITGRLTDVRSDVLLKDRLITASALELVATNEAVELTGSVRVGQAEVSGTWRQPIDKAATEAASITGTIELSDRSLGEFGVDLGEDTLSGSGRGQFTVTFPDNAPTRLELRSDLNGIGLAFGGTGWSKPRGTRGSLVLTASLGDRAEVDSLTLTAPGLDARGSLTTAEGGGLGEARFDRVKLGGWLDGPVVLTGRGPNTPMAIAVTGGTVDLRKADIGGGGGGDARGPKEPLTLALDRLIVTDGIQLTAVRADLDMAGGIHGTFSANVDGGAAIRGTVARQAQGAAFRITSADAGGVLRGAGLFDTARGGDLELILAPVKGAGTYEGEFTISDTRIVNAPAMAELLSAVSVVGLLDQLSGEGIGFGEVEGRFRLAPGKVTLYNSSAVGVSMGISLDGYYDMAGGTIDMQGVLSPLYILNALGRIFSPRDGEGLIGFNFTIAGDYNDPEVGVNPLSILTPGAFREIFRRPPPERPAE